MTNSPNIVFLLTDDQRYNTIRALGNSNIITPNMDWLVEHGAAFTHAHIPGGTSGAVCMPSRAMVHTGRTLFHITGAGEEIAEEHITLGEHFRNNGYCTFGVGKWHNGRRSYHRSFSDGAEIFFGGMADHWNLPAYNFDPTGCYDAACPYVEHPFSSNETKLRYCDHIHAGRHSTDIIADAVVRFLEQHEGEAPFLTYAAFLAPHDPRTMPRQFLEMYEPESLPLSKNFVGGHPFDNGDLHNRDEMLAGFPRTPEEVRRHLAEYYAMISHLDARIGDIIETVRHKGLLENTIFVLAGDNGLAVGQHGLFGKQNLYEHSVRVPLIFSGPGIPQGVRTEALVYLFDIFPTLCELSGISMPDTVEGISLSKAMRSPETTVRNYLYLAYTDKHRGVSNSQWKLIEYVVNGRHSMTQLFDLQHDPCEMHNLAQNAHGPTIRTMRKVLLELRDEWDDTASSWGKSFWEIAGPEILS